MGRRANGVRGGIRGEFNAMRDFTDSAESQFRRAYTGDMPQTQRDAANRISPMTARQMVGSFQRRLQQYRASSDTRNLELRGAREGVLRAAINVLSLRSEGIRI